MVLAGCTGSDDPKPTGSSSGSSTGSSASSSAPPGKSVDEVLGYQAPASVGSSKAKFTPEFSAAPSDLELNVASVRSTPTGTVLVYWVKAVGTDEGSMYVGRASDWDQQPTLVDAKAKKVYSVDTAGVRGGQSCVCTRLSSAYAEPRLNSALYAELPPDVSEVEVRLGPFPSVKVPVSR
jgi:hypothetical protein